MTQYHDFSVSRQFILWDPNNPPTDIIASNLSMAEKSRSGTVVGKLYMLDPDTAYGDAASFTLIDNAGGRFAIDGSNLVAGFVLSDAAQATTQTIIVRATDSGGLTFDKTIPITIIDGPDTPYQISMSVQSIPEDTPNYTTFSVLSAVVDEGDSVIFKIIADPDAKFYIDSLVNLQLQQPVNFEKKTSHSVTIRAISGSGLVSDQTFTLSVLDVNEAPTDLWLTQTQILGGSPAGSVVGTLGATDPDAGTAFTFTITSDPDAQFQIVGNQLQVIFAIDANTASSHDVSIRATDQGGLSYSKTFTIYFVQPLGIHLDTLTMPENVAAGSVINKLYVTGGTPVSYAYSNAADANGMFAVAVDGTVTTVGGPAKWDFETHPTATFTARATPTSGPLWTPLNASNQDGAWFDSADSSTITFATGINLWRDKYTPNANNATQSTTSFQPSRNANGTINFNSKALNIAHDYTTNKVMCDDWTIFVVFRTTQSTAAQSAGTWYNCPGLIYGDTSGVANDGGIVVNAGRFTTGAGGLTAGSDGGCVGVKNCADGKWHIGVSARVNASGAITQYVDGALDSTGTGPSGSRNNITTMAIGSKGFVGDIAEIVMINAVLSDAERETFVGALAWKWDGITGLTDLTGALPTSHTFKSFAPTTLQTLERAFTVSLTNMNEAPTGYTISNATVPEDAAVGAVIGVITAIDPDFGDTTTLVKLTDPDGCLDLVGNQVVLSSKVDWSVKTSHLMTFRITDNAGLSTDCSLTVNVSRVYYPPTNITLSNTTIPENAAPGAAVGVLSVTDVNQPGETGYTYAISSDPSGKFAISGNQLVATAPFNYEVDPKSYPIGVTVTDPVRGTFTKTLTVTVTNVNEAPTDIGAAVAQVHTNAAVGTTVATLTAVDPDAGETFAYAIVSDPSGYFKITGAAVQTKVTPTLKGDYPVTLRVTDAGGLTFDKSFSFPLLNNAPTNITLSASTFSDVAGANTAIATITGVDAENDALTFTLATNPSGYFGISGNSLINTAPVPAGAYAIDITATDTAGNTFTKSLTVTSLNQSPTAISLSTTSFDNSVPVGTTIATISGVDPENDALTYSLPSNPSTLFAISGASLKTNAASIGAGAHAITIRATDSAGNIFDKVFTITAVQTNNAPTNIALSNATVGNNVAAGAVIGALTTTDPDSGDTFTYSLTVNPQSLFAISGANLTTAVANVPFGTYAVTVRSTDHGGLFFDKQFSITVNYVYEAETTTLVNAMTVKPTTARQQAYDQIIKKLKTAGVWTKLDLLYITASHDSQASRLNWITPASFALTVVQSPVFNVDGGWTTGQTTATKLTTNWNFFTNAAKIGLNNMCLGVHALSNGTNAQGNQVAFGSSSAAIFVSTFTGASGLNRLQSTTNAPWNFATGGDNGLIQITRSDATNVTAYLNGANAQTTACPDLYTTNTAANTGWNFDLGGGQSTGPGGTASTTNGTLNYIRMAYAGSGFTAQQIADSYAAFNGYLSTVSPVYSTEAQTLFSKMTTQPTLARKGMIDTLITSLKTAGIWQLLDAFYILAAADGQASGLNWKNPGVNTLTGTGTFTADRGWAGNGTSDWLDTGLNATIAGQATLNSMTIAGYILPASATAQTCMGTGLSQLVVRTGGVQQGRINSSTTTSVGGGTTNDRGFTIMTRVDSATQFAQNKNITADTGVTSVAAASSSLHNSTYKILGSATANYSTAQVRMAAFGAGLDSAKWTAFYNAVFYYMNGIGAQL